MAVVAAFGRRGRGRRRGGVRGRRLLFSGGGGLSLELQTVEDFLWQIED
jgi:hypothetical protein